ncbi:MAG: ATP-dependent DNA ligase [Candidatus Aenigmarchaeota archaeon]|nr:ATP-dependent DNA ligase [Candidatus Aenigmarchaeota archaeon]
MKYSDLVKYYEELESTQSKLEKTKILAKLFEEADDEILEMVVLLSSGRVFPPYSEKELGIATKTMVKAISKATGLSEDEVEKIFKETGDLGLTAAECVKKRKQVTLLKKVLTVKKVFENLREIASIEGKKSQEKKMSLIAELFASAEPKEAIYITRTILEELRIGVAEGILRDAIVEAFLKPKTKEEREEFRKAVEYAWNIRSDFAEVARIAKKEGLKGLKKVEIRLGQPIQLMLGEKAKSIEEVIKKFGKVAIEYKYDGMRAEIHKKGDKIWVFTRRLENVTKQFPDIVELCKKGLKAEECIVEGEALAIDPKTGYPKPFQELSQRIQRKYNIEEMMKKIPIQLNLFDVTYVDGKKLFDTPFIERRKILESIVEEIPEKLQLAKEIITDDLKKAEEFYHEALNAKQEGVFLKVLDSKYVFGRHVGGLYKIKPIMETLDLVIVAAMWGEGKRANWLSSYVLAVRDPDTGSFLPCGMMGTGLTEDQFEEMTQKLKPLITSEKGKTVEVKPKIVVEVAYQEIQKSPNYESGYALRFPRLVRVRVDKSPEEADTIERLIDLYKSQGKEG